MTVKPNCNWHKNRRCKLKSVVSLNDRWKASAIGAIITLIWILITSGIAGKLPQIFNDVQVVGMLTLVFFVLLCGGSAWVVTRIDEDREWKYIVAGVTTPFVLLQVLSEAVISTQK